MSVSISEFDDPAKQFYSLDLAFLSSKVWINLRSFLTTGRFNFSEISSLIKEDCAPLSNKIRIFSSRLLFLELIKDTHRQKEP